MLSASNHQKRGFTLIELSLVLVVVAGLIAAVLIGARKMTAQARTTETVFAIQKFSQQFKDYLSQFNEGNAIFKTSDVNDRTDKAIAAGDVVPSELKLNGTADIISPYGLVSTGLYSTIRPLTFANNTFDRGIGGPYYGFYVTNLDYSRCVDLITAMASTDILVTKYGIIRVQVNNDYTKIIFAANDINTAGAGYVPLNKMVANSAGLYSCTKASLNNLLFAFRLR